MRRPDFRTDVMRHATLLAFFCACLLLAGCPSAGNQRTKLDQAQYAWSGAIRWNMFDAALEMIDPEVRAKAAPTALEMERYKQVKISSYRDVGASTDMDTGVAVRDIEIGVVNVHTMAERLVNYRETWRWDPEKKTWWLTSSLPDFWEGQ